MKLSVIIPCYNEEENIKKIYESLAKELKDFPYELLFIDDGSSDKTFEEISKLYKDDKDHVKCLSFSRNFGKEAAMYAGIKNSKGEYTCIIDADLQQNPKYILEMLNHLDKNLDIDQVAMYVENRNKKSLRGWLSSKFYKLINKISDTKLLNDASDFRMFRTNVRESILELSEVNRFSKGIFSWVGYKTDCLPYVVSKREKGNSKFSFGALIKYSIEGLVAFSIKPLRLITIVGLFTSLGSMIYLLIIIIQKLFFTVNVSGYSSMMSVILFFGGIQILFIGIIGEYLSKTYLETKKRPIYLTKNKIGFDNKNIL